MGSRCGRFEPALASGLGRWWYLVLAAALSAALWLAQDLGGLLSGSATDPNTAPLLALLAVSYWPSLKAS